MTALARAMENSTGVFAARCGGGACRSWFPRVRAFNHPAPGPARGPSHRAWRSTVIPIAGRSWWACRRGSRRRRSWWSCRLRPRHRTPPTLCSRCGSRRAAGRPRRPGGVGVDDDLVVDGVPVVLGLLGNGVVAGGGQGAVHDEYGVLGEPLAWLEGEHRSKVVDDSVRRRLRDPEQRGELPRALAARERLGYGAVGGQQVESEADYVVVGGDNKQPQRLHHPGGAAAWWRKSPYQPRASIRGRRPAHVPADRRLLRR